MRRSGKERAFLRSFNTLCVLGTGGIFQFVGEGIVCTAVKGVRDTFITIQKIGKGVEYVEKGYG